MDAIVTLTMNPALDINAATDRVIPGEKLRCTAPRYDPGGGGINVARAVRLLGGDAIAVFPLGGPTGARVEQLLKEAKIDYRALAIAGLTRESLTIDERRTGQQFRFVMAGPTLTEMEQERCLDQIFVARTKTRLYRRQRQPASGCSLRLLCSSRPTRSSAPV